MRRLRSGRRWRNGLRRLVWTLTIKEKDGSTAKSVEPGMDIFKKQPDGSWKIIRYMAYER